MKQHWVARMNGHVAWGDLRWNVTAYFPLVVTLFKLPKRDDGEFAAACATIFLFVTRSIENLTSAESKSDPSWNLTPLRRSQRHVLAVPTETHLVASDGPSFGPFLKSSRCSKTFASSVNVP